MSWTCEETRERLDEWVEGSLAEADAREVAGHLESCATCRAEAAEVGELRSAAAGLPREIRPPRDLWPGIDARLDADEVVPLRRARRVRPVSGLSRWGLVAAALALVLVTAVVTAMLTRRWDQAMALKLQETGERAPAAAGTAPGGVADQEARFLAASQELLTGLERQNLAPETMAIVRRNLATIDAAIVELQVALERDPGNGELNRMLLATYQRKIDLLEQAARSADG
ncbi:MAG TPA: zf-HC2 domain-containing protein [Gemmatimonadota bacterium]|nr:zf-HC2 domain-containing protein [Gemmatimonadota bacterium]